MTTTIEIYLFWLYCTTSENRKANALNDTYHHHHRHYHHSYHYHHNHHCNQQQKQQCKDYMVFIDMRVCIIIIIIIKIIIIISSSSRSSNRQIYLYTDGKPKLSSKRQQWTTMIIDTSVLGRMIGRSKILGLMITFLSITLYLNEVVILASWCYYQLWLIR